MLRSLVRLHALPPSTRLRCVLFSTGTSVSSSGVTASPDPHFMVKYPMNTCGFSADVASKGLDGANLRRIIAWKPGLLGRDVETNLAPKFKFLRDIGLSESDIIVIVRRNPIVIAFNSENALLPRFKDECGIPEERISLVLKRQPSFFLQKPDSLRALVDGVEWIGIARGSGMFLSTFDVLH
ncbi:hypothetical protein ZIOFF_058630 [Zingiber officinale]|uniref:Mitochondrial transcription termination factor family protein n=1 Tax=Zingiber officinale TaxID=94328 RepID=A0A8J5F9Y8_ZINOF|nr:hypothetical protein ZIOFF_058630 [Zingiber officinale]